MTSALLGQFNAALVVSSNRRRELSKLPATQRLRPIEGNWLTSGARRKTGPSRGQIYRNKRTQASADHSGNRSAHGHDVKRPGTANSFKNGSSHSVNGTENGHIVEHSVNGQIEQTENGNSVNGAHDEPASAKGSPVSAEELHTRKGLQDVRKESAHLKQIKNQVHLSTYGDSIGENLQDLIGFADKHLEGAIGGIHLLPIYPSSGDGGFAPITYDEVASNLGTWEDIEILANNYDLTLEFMVNHISPKSKNFQDWIEKGEKSEFSDMWVKWDEFWPEGRPTIEDLAKIGTRKAEVPCLEVTLKSGQKEKIWCTFGPEQIDINANSKPGLNFIIGSLRSLCQRGVKIIRLDAFGYATKIPGTRCFFEKPGAWDLLKVLEDVAAEYGVRLLCEVHECYKTNLELAHRGYWAYDFSLPLLILHAFHFSTAKNLRNWLSVCPHRQITVLDTHDGMGIDDVSGLAEVCDLHELSTVITERLGCNPTYKFRYNKETEEYDGTAHQYNCTYFSACQELPHHYILARALQFFTPGIPLVYYVGLFAGKNDEKRREMTGTGRAVNRHHFHLSEAESDLETDVVQCLLDLCRFRNRHKAFEGEILVIPEKATHLIEVCWKNRDHKATLHANLEEKDFYITATKESDPSEKYTISYPVLRQEKDKGRKVEKKHFSVV